MGRRTVKAITYAHRFGDRSIPECILREVLEAIYACPSKLCVGATERIKDEILGHLHHSGWPSEVMIDPTSNIRITSVKSKVGLCLQTGNTGRMYADLLKLQTLYLRGSIDAGIFIVPTHAAVGALGKSSNVVHLDRLSRELPIFERAVSVPLLAIGIE